MRKWGLYSCENYRCSHQWLLYPKLVSRHYAIFISSLCLRKTEFTRIQSSLPIFLCKEYDSLMFSMNYIHGVGRMEHNVSYRSYCMLGAVKYELMKTFSNCILIDILPEWFYPPLWITSMSYSSISYNYNKLNSLIWPEKNSKEFLPHSYKSIKGVFTSQLHKHQRKCVINIQEI